MCTTEFHNGSCVLDGSWRWTHTKKGDNRVCPTKYLYHRYGKGGHWWIDYPKDHQAALDFVKFAGPGNTDNDADMVSDDSKMMSSNEELMNTGATNHLFYDRKRFSSLRLLHQPIHIRIPSLNDSLSSDELTTTEHGEVTLCVKDTLDRPQEIVLKDVLHVPDIERPTSLPSTSCCPTPTTASAFTRTR
jgi:hypothetical protein